MSLTYKSPFMKCLFHIFNLVFVLSGIILLVVGLVIQGLYRSYSDVTDGTFSSVAVLLIVIGTFIFAVAFFGCCCAYKDNYCLTMTYCVSLILIFVLELSGGIAGYLLSDRLSDLALSNSMKSYNGSSHIRHLWDEMQANLECCGDGSPKDWLKISDQIPSSCCPERPQICDLEHAFKIGCAGALGEVLKGFKGTLGGVGIGIAIIQLLGIVFACNMASSIRGYESV